MNPFNNTDPDLLTLLTSFINLIALYAILIAVDNSITCQRLFTPKYNVFIYKSNFISYGIIVLINMIIEKYGTIA